MASVMLIVAISRGAKIPGYLRDLELVGPIEPKLESIFDLISSWMLLIALGTAGIIISFSMINGMLKSRETEKKVLEK